MSTFDEKVFPKSCFYITMKTPNVNPSTWTLNYPESRKAYYGFSQTLCVCLYVLKNALPFP